MLPMRRAPRFLLMFCMTPVNLLGAGKSPTDLWTRFTDPPRLIKSGNNTEFQGVLRGFHEVNCAEWLLQAELVPAPQFLCRSSNPQYLRRGPTVSGDKFFKEVL